MDSGDSACETEEMMLARLERRRQLLPPEVFNFELARQSACSLLESIQSMYRSFFVMQEVVKEASTLKRHLSNKFKTVKCAAEDSCWTMLHTRYKQQSI